MQHPWHRFVAIGDSFTEGYGDPDPASPGGLRGWADRVADVLGSATDGFAYANLAVRGKLLDQIAREQVAPALALAPDLITVSAGGNDVIRPGTDPDRIAERFDAMLARLVTSGATVVLFTGVDVGFSPVFRPIRGKVAIYNEHLRGIAARYGALVADQWSLRAIQDPALWADDRLHLNAFGHHEVARMVLRVLDVSNDLEPMRPEPVPRPSWRQARGEDLAWTRDHLIPWVGRRIRHVSSGDDVLPKRPDLAPTSERLN